MPIIPSSLSIPINPPSLLSLSLEVASAKEISALHYEAWNRGLHSLSEQQHRIDKILQQDELPDMYSSPTTFQMMSATTTTTTAFSSSGNGGGGGGMVGSMDVSTAAAVSPASSFKSRYKCSSSVRIGPLEVGPSHFEKLKLIGKGDVGRVYLVVRAEESALDMACQWEGERTPTLCGANNVLSPQTHPLIRPSFSCFCRRERMNRKCMP